MTAPVGDGEVRVMDVVRLLLPDPWSVADDVPAIMKAVLYVLAGGP